TCAEIFLVLPARLAEVDVAVDHAGQHVLARRVVPLLTVDTQLTWCCDGDELAVLDREIGWERRVAGDHGAVLDNQVCPLCHVDSLGRRLLRMPARMAAIRPVVLLLDPASSPICPLLPATSPS